MANTQTKQIIKEIGKDAGRCLARAGKATLESLEQVVCKASYPILGNLSANLQNRIQDAVGKEHYNSVHATRVSMGTNAIVYPSLFYELLNNAASQSQDPGAMTAYIVGLGVTVVAGVAEAMFRGYADSESAFRVKNDSIASLAGKLVSLPFDELTYAYDTGKKYLQDVKKRVQYKESQGGGKTK